MERRFEYEYSGIIKNKEVIVSTSILKLQKLPFEQEELNVTAGGSATSSLAMCCNGMVGIGQQK